MGELKEILDENGKNLTNEYKKVVELENKELKVQDTWYVIDNSWYKQWKKYVNSNDNLYHKTENPGPVDNSGLFEDPFSQEIRDNLVASLDYTVLPEEAWDILVEHYGIAPDQKPIKRKVIEQGKYTKECVVELYPVLLKLCLYNKQDDVKTERFSRSETIEELNKKMRKIFEIPNDVETKLWDAAKKDNYSELEISQSTVEYHSLQKNQLVVMETKGPDTEWQIQKEDKKVVGTSTFYNGNLTRNSNTNGSSSSSGMFSSSSGGTSFSNYQLRNSAAYSDSYGRKNLTPGLCGLNNLGNTCFMNSALQCLSNVPSLTNYFKENKYLKELNEDNPLGMHGEIAKTYANLIQMMWSGQNSSVAPRDFKRAVGQFQPRFVGYQQQDSQELIAFLIDGLHEDLNRITNKPYIEIKDAGDRPHHLVAQEAWENHLKRNDSVIVDTLHGLFRSIVDCPECPRVSVTFDPFCYLTLPLPSKKDKSLECTFVPLDPNRDVVKYKVTVPKLGFIEDLCKALSELNGVPYEEMVVTDVYNNRFHKVFPSSDQIRTIYDKDQIYIYQKPMESRHAAVYLRYVSHRGSYLFGLPLIVASRDETFSFVSLYKNILSGVYRYIVDENLKAQILQLFEMSEKDVIEKMKESQIASEETEDANIPVFNLFAVKSVNSFGSQEYKQFNYDDTDIKTSADNFYLAADWSKAAFDSFFTEHWDRQTVRHESLLPTNSKVALNLKDCVELFTLREKLGKNNTWYCSNCKKHQQAYKKFDLWMLPPVLIIHLKRFRSNSQWNREKIDTPVDYPIADLDLSDFVVNPLKENLATNKRRYNLIAVSNHFGGLGGGHYTAFAKNNVDKKWYYFDDSSVSMSSQERVVTKAAYMLVYQRQDVEEWLEQNNQQPFPFLEPIFSPRAMDYEPGSNGKSFVFHSKEDVLNNNSSEDAMDTS